MDACPPPRGGVSRRVLGVFLDVSECRAAAHIEDIGRNEIPGLVERKLSR